MTRLAKSNTTARADGQNPCPRPTLCISVIVPVRNEGRFIERTLRQLLSQDYPPGLFEILVVDGQSTDDTFDVARGLAENDNRLRLFSNPRKLSSAARNVGIAHARGDVILVVDGHCEISSNQMLADLAQAFEQSGADCVGRPQPLDVSNASVLQRAIAAARSSRLGHHPDSFIYSSQSQFVPAKSVAVAYRREVFDLVGGFDEHFDACEDVEFNHRCDLLGLRCYLAPNVAVKYYPRETLGELFRQMVRYGRGRVSLARKHPGTISPRTFLPAAFVAGLVAGGLLSPFAPAMAFAYVLGLLIYATVILCASAWIALRGAEPRLLPWLPLVLVTIHLAAGVGICREWFSVPRGRIGQ